MAVSHFKKILFKTIVILQIAYLMLSLFIPPMPGWKMFATLELTPFNITNLNTGLVIDANKYMVPVYYTVSNDHLLELAQFICRKEKIPVKIEILASPKIVKEYSKNDCGI